VSKILAIDDDKRNLVILSGLLKEAIPGVTVVKALSGKEGLKLAREESPDVILLDVQMPEPDGFEVCRRLKTDPATASIPVVFLTAANTDPQSHVKGLELGAEAFLAKPVDEHLLAAEVKAMLRIKKAEDLLRREKTLLADTVEERTRELAATEKRFRALLNALTEAAFLVAGDGTILACNDTAARGPWGGADPAGSDIFKVFGKEGESGRKGRMEHVIKTGEPVHWEDTWGERILNVSMYPVPDAEGGVQQAAVYARDVTEQKKMEASRQLLEIQLRQAQKMEAIGTLAGGIAHDFNNILGTIIGYAEMMEMFDLEAESPLRPQILEILKAAERARNLVRQILTFSRQTEKEQIRTGLAPLIKEAMVFLRASLPSSIRFDVDVRKDTGEVMADPTQVYQMLMNLCTNAAQAMKEKGGTLTVTLSDDEIPEGGIPGFPAARPGPAVCLSVADTGVGMSREVLENIFDPYFTTREGGDGTGLGLAVVHGIVNGHLGGIRVTTLPGRGSTFSVYLPRIVEKAAAAGQPSRAPGNRLPTGTESILFVDDEESLCSWGRMILSRLGYRVETETAGERALDLLRREPGRFNLIITDETMPGMLGSDLADRVRKANIGVPVILCSGHGTMMNVADYREKGVARILAKPLGARVLADVVRQLLDGNGE